MAPSTPLNSSVRKRRVASPGLGIANLHLPRETTIQESSLMGLPAATQHRLKAYPEKDEQTRQHRQHIGLLDLPCEILEAIGLELCGTQSVIEFGLVNRRIHGVVRQATARKLIVSRKIRAFIGMLGNHPELIDKVSHVDLGDFGCIHHQKCLCLGKPSLDKQVLEVIGRAIAANTNNLVKWNHIREEKRSSGGVWRAPQAFFINVLASLCPNIKSVKIELPEASVFTSSQPPRPIHLAPYSLPSPNPEFLPVAPFQGPALRIMQQRLEVLTIAENTRWKGPATVEILEAQDLTWRNMGTHTITLAGFSKLKRLDVPMSALGRPQSIVFLDPTRPTDTMRDKAADAASPSSVRKINMSQVSRTKVIPLTIRYLHLRSCGKWTFAFLQSINSVPVEDFKLKHIELFFNIGPQQIVAQCTIVDEGRFSYSRVLMELARKGIKISFYTGPEEVPLDMLQELLTLSAISPMELWRFALSRVPFTALNRQCSVKRRSSTIASRLFLRHVGHHFQLFNSPTFEATSWIQGAFFHGVKNTRWDPQLQDCKAKVRLVGSRGKFVKAWITRSFPALRNLDTFDFCFRVSNDCTQLPKEISFLGATFTFPENARTQQVERRLSTKTQESTEGFKKAYQGTQASGGENYVKSLMDPMTRLRVGPGRSNLSHETTTTDSSFRIVDWIHIEWKSLLEFKALKM
ncbi:hypothetical protein Ptr902_00709 [Pyrenophora tritici-repentis]|nr:hypothetical protein Ptr902_00709 [Pyrenophora tritici-repentis]